MGIHLERGLHGGVSQLILQHCYQHGRMGHGKNHSPAGGSGEDTNLGERLRVRATGTTGAATSRSSALLLADGKPVPVRRTVSQSISLKVGGAGGRCGESGRGSATPANSKLEWSSFARRTLEMDTHFSLHFGEAGIFAPGSVANINPDQHG